MTYHGRGGHQRYHAHGAPPTHSSGTNRPVLTSRGAYGESKGTPATPAMVPSKPAAMVRQSKLAATY